MSSVILEQMTRDKCSVLELITTEVTEEVTIGKGQESVTPEHVIIAASTVLFQVLVIAHELLAVLALRAVPID